MDDEAQRIEDERLRKLDEDIAYSELFEAATAHWSYDWSGLPGKVHATFQDGLETWLAHDAGLFHLTMKAIAPVTLSHLERRNRYNTDLVLWRDVRDVEVGSEFVGTLNAMRATEWSIACQYPALRAKRSIDEFRDFVLAVARLAAEHR